MNSRGLYEPRALPAIRGSPGAGPMRALAPGARTSPSSGRHASGLASSKSQAAGLAKAESAPAGGGAGCCSHIVQVVAVEGAGGARGLAGSTHLCSPWAIKDVNAK